MQSLSGKNEFYPTINLVPTTANVTGAFDGYLYVPMNGANYRYERIFDDPASVTKGELIHSFTEEAEPSDVNWRVYSVREYPDKSFVLAEADDDYVQLYRHSPPKAVDPDRLTAAKASGMVALEDGYATFGQEIWANFFEKVQDGKDASVSVAHYHTLENGNYSGKFYEAYKEDYPSLFEMELTYDGTYTMKWNEYGIEYVRTYNYLRVFEDILPTPQSSREPQQVIRYVLTNDADATWDTLVHGLASAQLGDHSDFYTIYAEKVS